MCRRYAEVAAEERAEEEAERAAREAEERATASAARAEQNARRREERRARKEAAERAAMEEMEAAFAAEEERSREAEAAREAEAKETEDAAARAAQRLLAVEEAMEASKVGESIRPFPHSLLALSARGKASSTEVCITRGVNTVRQTVDGDVKTTKDKVEAASHVNIHSMEVDIYGG